MRIERVSESLTNKRLALGIMHVKIYIRVGLTQATFLIFRV